MTNTVDAQANREALVVAVAEQVPPAMGPLTAAQEKARSIREEVQRTKDPRPVLEKLGVPQPSDLRRAERSIDENIGTERNPDASKNRAPGSNEEKRFKQAKFMETLAKELNTKGWDKITDPNQKTILRNFMRQTLPNFPGLQEYFDGLGPGEQVAMLDQWLGDKNIQKLILPKFLEKASAMNLDDEVTRAKRVQEDKETAAKAAEKQLDTNKKGLKNVNDELAEFGDVPPGSGTPGKYKTELDTYNANKTTWEANVRAAQLEIKKFNGQAASLRTEFSSVSAAIAKGGTPKRTLAEIQSELDTLEDQINDQEERVAENNKNLAKKEELDAKRRELTNQKNKFEEDQPGLETADKRAKSEKLQADADLAIKQRDREQQEIDYIDNLKTAFTDSMKDAIADKFAEYEKAQNAMLDRLAKEAEEAGDPVKNKVLEALKSRYRKVDVSHRKPKVEWQKRAIDNDYKKLLSTGPNTVIRDILHAEMPTMNNADIEQYIQDHPDAVKELQDSVAEKIIASRMRTGKITDSEAEVIFDAPWGKDALAKAITNNEQLKGQVDKLKEQGVITSTPDFLDKVKKHAIPGLLVGGGLAAILAMIFAAGPIGLGIAGGIAAASGASSEVTRAMAA